MFGFFFKQQGWENKWTQIHKKGGEYMLNIADHSYTFPLHEMEELNILGEN